MINLEKVIAFVLFLLVLPFLIPIILLSAVSTKSFGLFKQIRIGQFGKPFTIYKIKTMHNGNGTLIGKILRKSKIDELPQLINIIKGDMSFVGPRPDVPGYYDMLKGSDKEVLNLKPGLTSLASIKYVNEEALLSKQKNAKYYNDSVIFPDKLQMNLDYCNKKSLRYDLYIIGLTLKGIFVKNKISI